MLLELLFDRVPAKAVTRVVANFSNIADRSSILICGGVGDVVRIDDDEDVGIDCDGCDDKEADVDVAVPTKTNFAASCMSSNG